MHCRDHGHLTSSLIFITLITAYVGKSSSSFYYLFILCAAQSQLSHSKTQRKCQNHLTTRHLILLIETDFMLLPCLGSQWPCHNVFISQTRSPFDSLHLCQRIRIYFFWDMEGMKWISLCAKFFRTHLFRFHQIKTVTYSCLLICFRE